MLRLNHITATGILVLGLCTNLSAEMMNIPAAEVTEYSIQLPGRGMTMETVRNKFGEAKEKFSAVGDPPISKWTYDNFTVYFESEFVIHAVVINQ